MKSLDGPSSAKAKPTFNELVKKMPELLQKLKAGPLLTRENLKGIPQKGVYIFYENGKPLYVGRSNNMKDRILEHGQNSSGHHSAQFAFNLAKEEMKIDQGIHSSHITRKELEDAPGFKQAFFEARMRVRDMKVRVVEIDNQLTQALFEIYAALTLKTPYNDFSTH
jgi:hypothetical protein